MEDFQTFEFDIALDYLRNPFVAENIFDENRRVLVIQIPENIGHITPRDANEFFERIKLLNVVTVGVVSSPISGKTRPELDMFDVILSGPDTSCGLGVSVPNLAEGISEIVQAVTNNPQSAITLVQLLRQRAFFNVSNGLALESVTYAMLQSGPEFNTWLTNRGDLPQHRGTEPTVLSLRQGSLLELSLNRPNRANAFSAEMRDQLVEQLQLADIDKDLNHIVHRSEGDSFCSGGDLSEFGLFDNPVDAHLIRMTRNPASWIHKLNDRVTVYLTGNCIGAGIELPSFAHKIIADETLKISLPEIQMGLIPGSGGTVSLPRRIGAQRTVYLAITGRTIDLNTARAWNLVDEVGTYI